MKPDSQIRAVENLAIPAAAPNSTVLLASFRKLARSGDPSAWRGREPDACSPGGTWLSTHPNLDRIGTDNLFRISGFKEGLFCKQQREVNKLGSFQHFPFCAGRESGSARRDGVFTCQVTHLRSY